MRRILAFMVLALAVAPLGAQVLVQILGGGSQVITYCSSVGYPTSPVSTNLQVWFNASSAVCSGACANNSALTAWNDLSVNARNASITAGSATYKTSQINGKDAVSVNALFQYANTIGSGNDAHSAYVVFNNTGSTQARLKGTTGTFLYAWINPQEVDCQGLSVQGKGSLTVTSGVWNQANVIQSGPTTLAFRLNRAADTLSTGPNVCNATPPFIFGYDSGTGLIAEIFYYNVAEGATDRLKNECYLYGKYGI